jgi:5-methylcytosine-specific restriction endonuclease McrA
MSLASLGKPKSEDHKKKLRVPKSEEHKRKLKQNHVDYNKEKNPNWQGGKSFEPYTLDWTDTLKKAIRERDHYTCKICLKEGIVVHHIDYNKANCDPKNLITLCSRCHIQTNYNRGKWIKHFEEIRHD